ncbi:MAG: carboxysome shell protein [Gammaproteobacteria bacterium SG8_15]|nr:MAG: carboxysome shell protein [Gammaproteobacteria bacterium SG8_15]
MLRTARKQNALNSRARGTAPLRRPGAIALRESADGNSADGNTDVGTNVYGNNSVTRLNIGAQHPLCRNDENARLLSYEDEIKQAFDSIVPTLKMISAIQHESDFEDQAQRIARERLGFELPTGILEDAWVEQLDMRRLFAWCVFNTYKRFCDEFFVSQTSSDTAVEDFDAFLQSCGFHTMDVTPCADGRLAHLIRYVLRLPPRAVRRKSYAGAMFDVEDSLEKWMEIELQRFREGKPNTVDAPTRYLKVVAYHFSSGNPDHEGCAAHGSDTQKAAQAGLERLINFRQAIENSYCCGASIDLLLIGVDTDTDSMRVHIPDGNGQMELDRYVDTKAIYAETTRLDATSAMRSIESAIQKCSPEVTKGMAQLVIRLIENNLSQIAYVLGRHGGCYPDIGHAERFIGAGVGFEDIQLRNLMYFAYLNTVEEGAADLDVGIKIFKGLNVSHSLPVPVVVRFDYHGHVPGARERAEQRCGRVAQALSERYEDLYQQGLLHVLQVARDCDGNSPLEIFACSVITPEVGGH